jgi:hypothetical protein
MRLCCYRCFAPMYSCFVYFLFVSNLSDLSTEIVLAVFHKTKKTSARKTQLSRSNFFVPQPTEVMRRTDSDLIEILID